MIQYKEAKNAGPVHYLTIGAIIDKEIEKYNLLTKSLEELSQISSKLEKKDCKDFYSSLEQKLK